MTMEETRSKEARGAPSAGERDTGRQRARGPWEGGPLVVGDLHPLEEPQGSTGKRGQE
jgi:hypothetical protein